MEILSHQNFVNENKTGWVQPYRPFFGLRSLNLLKNDEVSIKKIIKENKELLIEDNSENSDNEVLIKNYVVDDNILKSSIRSQNIGLIKSAITKNEFKKNHVEYAISSNAVAVITCLIEENYEINYMQCIKLAITYRNFKAMQTILIDACPKEKLLEFAKDNSLLHHAARFGHIELIELLIKYDEDIIYNKNSMEQQAVHCIGIDDVKMGKLLITDKNINATDKHCWTPLHCFVSKNLIELATFFINYKDASIDAKNSSKESPLHMACTKGCYEMVKLFIDNNAKINKEEGKDYKDIYTPLTASVISGNADLDIIKLFLSNNVDTTTKSFGKTALHFAILTGKCQIVEALINEKKSLNIEDDEKRTPLDLARKVLHKNNVIIKFLVYKQAKESEYIIKTKKRKRKVKKLMV